jgi:hypothetical protein
MPRTPLVLLGALLALALPTTASADVVFGSPLTDPANLIPFQHGWDQNVFNTSGPVGVTAPQPGLIKQVNVKGGSGDGQPLTVQFRVIRANGSRWKAISTPMVASLPPNDGQVHSYPVPDPRAFRVETGDFVAIFQQGEGSAQRTWQIFSQQPGWTTQKVAVNDGFKDSDLSPDPPVDQEGNSTVTYQDTELLLQAVESDDQCPGTDLPQLPCQSKLYLGGKVKKGARSFRYTWTLRNGGPHPASGVNLRVNLPLGTRVPGLPEGCELTVGPPLAVICDVGDIPPPQEGNAVRQVSFTAVPKKVTSFFRAVGQIEAPNIVDPNGDSKHLKTVSASTRFHGPHS